MTISDSRIVDAEGGANDGALASKIIDNQRRCNSTTVIFPITKAVRGFSEELHFPHQRSTDDLAIPSKNKARGHTEELHFPHQRSTDDLAIPSKNKARGHTEELHFQHQRSSNELCSFSNVLFRKA